MSSARSIGDAGRRTVDGGKRRPFGMSRCAPGCRSPPPPMSSMAPARLERRAAARCSKQSRRSTIGSTARPALFEAGPPASSAWSSPTSPTSFSPASCIGSKRSRNATAMTFSSSPQARTRRKSAAASRRSSPAASTGSSSCRQATISMAALNSGGGWLALAPGGAHRPWGRGAPFDTVRADCFAGGYAAARHLIDLGHRDIAIFRSSNRLDNIEQRIAGCRRALGEAGLNERDRVIYGGHDLESLRGAIDLELNRADRPTAIFALTNVCALASIKAARGLGLEIPGDVSIVGFDDFDWMWALRPYLTTVAQAGRRFRFRRLAPPDATPQGRGGERGRAHRTSLHPQGAGIDRARPPSAQGRRGGLLNHQRHQGSEPC